MKLDMYRFSGSASAVLAILTGLFCGYAQAENAVSPLATGGRAYPVATADGVDYVHVFSNTQGAEDFQNTSGKALDIRYLVVGGGGAGGTTTGSYAGGGGGGGGGVFATNVSISADTVWSIRVGAGGVAATSYSKLDTDAGASAISNGTEEVICVPGGGHGSHGKGDSGSLQQVAQAGAAGGGGGSYTYDGGTGRYGAVGTFESFVDGVSYTTNSGGSMALFNMRAVGEKEATRMLIAGGGGGAASAGETRAKHTDPSVPAISGAGGNGIACDITGATVYYGAGGGGGGMTNVTLLANAPYYAISGGEGGSGVGGNGGTFVVEGDDIVLVAAKAGLDGTGSGGGGGIGGCQDKSPNFKGGNGGDGAVVIRYHAKDLTWNSAEDTPAFTSLGAAGMVSYKVSGEVERDGDVVYLKPGKTATLLAFDNGGNILSGWEDSETGEFIRGDLIEVTPATRRTYTAVFGKPWTRDSKTISNGEWTFRYSSGVIYSCQQAPANASVLNLATPMYNSDGTPLASKVRLGNGATTPFVTNKFTQAYRIFLPEGFYLHDDVFSTNCENAIVTGAVSIPRGIEVRDSAFAYNTGITKVFFEGGAEGGQTLESSVFAYCANLAKVNPLPDSIKNLPSSTFRNTALKEIEMPAVTNVAVLAFTSTPLTNVVFGTNTVYFGNRVSSSVSYYGYYIFSGVDPNCAFRFPGKAPVLKCCGTYTSEKTGREYPYTGAATNDTKQCYMFGDENGVRFYGSWRNDPEGWEKIRNEVGSSDWSDKDPSVVPSLGAGDRSVKGCFYWWKESRKIPFNGWLIDTEMPGEPSRSGMMLYLK